MRLILLVSKLFFKKLSVVKFIIKLSLGHVRFSPTWEVQDMTQILK